MSRDYEVAEMCTKNLTGAAALALVLGLLSPGPTHAQFSPFVTLPTNDFTWRWGRDREVPTRRYPDFSVSGNDGSFQCELTGKFSPFSNMTMADARELETEIRANLMFIQSAAYAMSVLDQNREIDWAELACVKYVPPERSAEESQEKVDKAREKAVQEMLERRERQRRKDEQTDRQNL
jgi:hypothetical protein